MTWEVKKLLLQIAQFMEMMKPDDLLQLIVFTSKNNA